MNRIVGALVVFVAWSIACGALGWAVRDGRADAVEARKETAVQTDRADQAEAARTTDHANAGTSARIESARVERAAERESTFDQLQQDVTAYARTTAQPTDPSHSIRDRGRADPEFMRIWRAANAGRLDGPRPEHRPGTDAAGGDPAATD